MRAALAFRVQIAWLFLTAILAAAVFILWKLAILDAPPSNSLLISEATRDTSAPTRSGYDPEATITALSEALAALQTARPSNGAALNGETAATLEVAPATVTPPPPAASPATIAVYVSGAVKSPGVYTLREGSRVADAVESAGGLTGDADASIINLAARLSDEQHVVVPRIGEAAQVPPTPAFLGEAPAPGATPSGAAGDTARLAEPPPLGKININTANAKQLEQLPGIGPVLAARIVEHRRANGPFRTPEDLMKVPGIKQGIFGQVRDHITVGP